jgi:hypothetical protein
MTRVLNGLIMTDGTDDENWPWSDEKIHTQHRVQMMLDENSPASEIQVPHVRWGGECRVELDLRAAVVGSGQVQLEGEARFYEGDDENTVDLEDRKTISFLVPKGGRTAQHNVNLVNSGTGGGDHAEIRMTFTNAFFEPEE